MATGILWPTIAMVALIFAVWITLVTARLGHVKRHPPTVEDFASGTAALAYFAPVEMPANNLRNLFEMPVLFFALVPLLILTGHAGSLQVGLAWAYVGLRVIHTLIHIGRGKIINRFRVYLLSCGVLAAMWVLFAVGLATGA